MGDPSRTTAGARHATVSAAIEPVLASLGLDLEDLEIQASGRRRRVCVVVDRDGGIDLDGIAEASRAVSDALDESDAMGEDAYTLEMTSPGVDRPLTLPRHWRRNAGRRVRAHMVDGTVLDGRIRSADDLGVVLAVDTAAGAEGEERPVEWGQLVRGEVQIEFRRPGSDGEES